MWKERVEPTLQPAEKLRHIDDLTVRPFDPRVVMFAKFLADRISTNDEILPHGFLMASALAIYDLEQGVSGFTGEQLRTGLEGQPPYVYQVLSVNVPELADIAFPKEFADEVREGYDHTNEKIGNEFVARPVTTLDEAMASIVQIAKDKVEKLDWEHFGAGDKREEISKVFNTLYGLILRNAGMNFPLNVLQEDVFDEALILKQTGEDRKMRIADGRFWLVLVKKEISVEEATVMRDWVYMKSVEGISIFLHLSPQEVTQYFIDSDPSYLRAAMRIREALAHRRV